MRPHNTFIYSNLDFTCKSAGATRMRYYAKALASDRHGVYLVNCSATELIDENFVEVEPNIFIFEYGKMTKDFFGTFSFLRRLHRFANSKSTKKSFLYYPYPLLFLEVLSLIYLRLYKGESVFNELNEIRKYSAAFHDPMSLTRPVYSIKKIIFKTGFTLVQPLLRFYSGLICISTNIERYGKKFNKNALRIPILTDPNISMAKSGNSYFSKGSFNIGFSGTIHPTKENLDSFIQAVYDLSEKGIKVSFNLCGHIFKTYRSHFLKQCESRDEINYYGNLDEMEFSTFLSQQDLLVIPRGFSLQNKYGFSTKLSDYLNHKKVVLITDISDNKLYIKDGINGFVVPPNDSQAMFEKLEFIITNFDSFKDTIISNAQTTSSNDFYYGRYSKALRQFFGSENNDH